ncbi:hypothetical protein T06_1087 [Trichinella sp. T6]|nr:hypothetical protein T06_1087 [Trichinella sp. T6]
MLVAMLLGSTFQLAIYVRLRIRSHQLSAGHSARNSGKGVEPNAGDH